MTTEQILKLIVDYWYLVPTIMAVASVIVNATPTETDNKLLANLDKILNIIAANFNVKGESLKKQEKLE